MRIRIVPLLIVIVLRYACACSAAVVHLPSKDFDKYGKSRVIVNTSWGSGPGQIGLTVEPDVQPQGAKSFAVGKDGSVYILDQVNQRVQHFDKNGKHVKSLPADRPQLDNIAVSDTGAVYVVDSIVARKVWQLGKDKKSWDLPDLSELRFVTDMMVEGEDVSVEAGHVASYPVTKNGKALSDQAVRAAGTRGRKTKGPVAFSLGARLASKNEVVLTGESDLSFTLNVRSERDILGIETLGTDRRGRMYLGLLLYEEGPAPDYKLLGSCFYVACLRADGTLYGQVDMPETTHTEGLRRLMIGDDGTIYQLQTDESGVRVVAWTLEDGGQAR